MLIVLTPKDKNKKLDLREILDNVFNTTSPETENLVPQSLEKIIYECRVERP